MFLVFQTMLNLDLSFVNIMSFLIRLFVNFSFETENGSHKIINFRSSNNHSGIIQSSSSLLKYLIVFLIKCLGKPVDKNFLVICFTSKLKSLAILLTICNYGITFMSGWNF